MIDLNLIIEALKAKPFEPFALTLVTNERLKVPTKGHVAIPPLDEASRVPKWIVVFNAVTGKPRYLSLESIASLDHGD
jgi:hypothetical protein